MPISISGSGSITGISAGGLPDAIIQQADLAANVAGNGPAFSAYQSSAQSSTASTATKVQFQTEVFDTNGNFDNATNYRFTPTVAGYYQITGAVQWGFITGVCFVAIYKNGANAAYSNLTNATLIGAGATVTSLVYLNGSTDYVELYMYQSNGTNNSTAAANATYFNGALVRAA